jgi:predicted dehydrogenase
VATFALIGSGWRARMFLKVARELGTVRCGGVVVRTPRHLDVPIFTSLEACLQELNVDFVLTATPRHVTPRVIADAVNRGIPVLAETPPAPDLDGLRALWSAVGDSGLVQVAEQYPMMPSHAARAALVAADPGAGLLNSAVPRHCADPRFAHRRPRTGYGPGHPVHSAACQSIEPHRLDRR